VEAPLILSLSKDSPATRSFDRLRMSGAGGEGMWV